MKRILLLPVFVVLLLSCGGNNTSGETKKDSTNSRESADAANDELSMNPVYRKGLALASKSDCFTCHHVDEKVTGPSYREVADKYASYPDTIVTYLAKKIINGGTGAWGQAAMTPHPALSQEDAEAMVRYVLLLKSKK